MQPTKKRMHQRFRGFLPVVIDLETSGLEPTQHAILEIAAVSLTMDEQGLLLPETTHHNHVLPFEGASMDPKALEINQIDPEQPLRFAIEETEALQAFYDYVHEAVKRHQCDRAVLVAHNVAFDMAFMMEAANRHGHKKLPFHRFTTFDTATLAAAAYGETVLSKAMRAARIPFDGNQAHSALYDTQKTAELFCQMINADLKSS